MDVKELIEEQVKEVDREYDKFDAFLDVSGFDFEWRMYGLKDRIDQICRLCRNKKKLRELLTPFKGASIEEAVEYCERRLL